MAKIVVLDLNNSNLVDLDNQQAEQVIGGAFGAIGGGVASILNDYARCEPINWGAACAWALGGSIAGYPGGLVGQALA